jgi:hypothetical protein
VEVLKRNSEALRHGLLTLTNPDTGVVVLLVGLVIAVRVTDLSLEVARLVLDVVADTSEVSVLHVGVEVDLYDTVSDSLPEVVDTGARSTVENKEDGLVLLGANGLLDVLLVLLEETRLELDIAGLVDTVDVTEASGDGEVGGDLRQLLVDVQDVLGLSVEGVVVNILVVDTILLTTGDTNLHLEPLLHGGSTLEVLLSGLDVVLNLLLRQIDHVGREERLVVLLEVRLVGVEHAVQPWQKLLRAVVGVENDGDAVGGRDSADVVSGSNGTSDGGGLVLVVDALASEVCGTTYDRSINCSNSLCHSWSRLTLGGLEDDGRLGVAGSLKRSNDCGGGGHLSLLIQLPQSLIERNLR